MITSPNATAIPFGPIPPRSVLATIAPHPANTSANVADASARQRRPSEGLGKELADQRLDARVDLVTDAAHGGDVLAGGVVERPVLVALAGVDRAGVAAAHRDH